MLRPGIIAAYYGKKAMDDEPRMSVWRKIRCIKMSAQA
jgi:hypothetical protein